MLAEHLRMFVLVRLAVGRVCGAEVLLIASSVLAAVAQMLLTVAQMVVSLEQELEENRLQSCGLRLAQEATVPWNWPAGMPVPGLHQGLGTQDTHVGMMTCMPAWH